MALSNTDFSEENPFKNIKVRHLFLWMVLITFGLAFQIAALGSAFGFDPKDDPLFEEPILSQLTNLCLILLTVIWLLRQCKL